MECNDEEEEAEVELLCLCQEDSWECTVKGGSNGSWMETWEKGEPVVKGKED